MPDFSAFFPLIAVIIGAVVVIAVIWLATKLMWKVAEPNEALIISGLTRGTLDTRDGMDFKIVTGKGALVIPGLQTVRTLSLTLNETELKVSCVTSQGIQVMVEGVVIYKIGDAPPFIANAARRFLGQQPKMESQVYNVFEGHLRSIIGSMTMEEIIRERDKLAPRSAAPAALKWKSSAWWSIRCRSRTWRIPPGTSRTSPSRTSPRSRWRPASPRPPGTGRRRKRRPRRRR